MSEENRMSETVWQNQKKINGNLCRVDWRLIQALQAVSDILEKIPGGNPAAIASLKESIQEADRISEIVAGDDPPGCVPARTD
jgi:hypothetical protein